MKKLLIIFFINIFAFNSAYSVEEVLTSLKEGGKIIFIRHALAPGNGDPENFDLNDCSTQRNLNQRGIEQSKFIADVEQYWTNVRECVNFENNEISKELSIVSEDTKSRLSQAINNIDVKKPDTVVVATPSQDFAMVN